VDESVGEEDEEAGYVAEGSFDTAGQRFRRFGSDRLSSLLHIAELSSGHSDGNYRAPARKNDRNQSNGGSEPALALTLRGTGVAKYLPTRRGLGTLEKRSKIYSQSKGDGERYCARERILWQGVVYQFAASVTRELLPVARNRCCRGLTVRPSRGGLVPEDSAIY